MITITEPRQTILRLWGKPTISNKSTYRLMTYVHLVEIDSNTALYNFVTGQMVVLNSCEEQFIKSAPGIYHECINELIYAHFLVPQDYEDHKIVISLRTILRRMKMNKKREIDSYTILPTTSCNARCYYCFEAGMKQISMSNQVAEQVIEFIKENCGEKRKIHITWFGGEPTIASNRISQICQGLQDNDIEYSSFMYTNGYLLDEKLARTAKELWHLTSVQIVVDGLEESYNRIKSYVNSSGSPFQIILHNIGLLLEQKIRVVVRTNVDIENYQDYRGLVDLFYNKFNQNDLLKMYAYPLIGEYKNSSGQVVHGDDTWMAEKVVELNNYSREFNMHHLTEKLPSLVYNGCMADNDSAIVINANGEFTRCLEQPVEKSDFGNLSEGIFDEKKYREWREISYYESCYKCKFFPLCMKMRKCGAQGKCYQHNKTNQYEKNIEKGLIKYLSKEE